MKPLNCDGCTVCCQGDMIFLHPECGDNHLFFETDQLPDGRYVLKHKKNGDCIYLNDSGCGIYPVRPTICRELDCRVVIKKLGYTRSKKLAKQGLLNMNMVRVAMRKMR